MTMQAVPADTAGRMVSVRELWQEFAAGVAAGLPVPHRLSFDTRDRDRCPAGGSLFVDFASSSDLDAWLRVWGQPQTYACVVCNEAGAPMAWLYRPDRHVVEWLGWLVYPMVSHQITPEMLAGPVEAGDR